MAIEWKTGKAEVIDTARGRGAWKEIASYEASAGGFDFNIVNTPVFGTQCPPDYTVWMLHIYPSCGPRGTVQAYDSLDDAKEGAERWLSSKLEINEKTRKKGGGKMTSTQVEKKLELQKVETLSYVDILNINERLGKEFGTDAGPGGNISNLGYALTRKDPYKIAKEILRGIRSSMGISGPASWYI